MIDPKPLNDSILVMSELIRSDSAAIFPNNFPKYKENAKYLFDFG